jgi:hypothetical protein
MWIQAEIWDKLAEESSSLGKGSFLNGVGTMICDKWIDKNTGEEKKMLKLRILKLLSKEAVNGIVAAIRPEVSNDSEQFLGTESTSALEVAKVSAEKLVLPEGMEDNVTDDVEDETFRAGDAGAAFACRFSLAAARLVAGSRLGRRNRSRRRSGVHGRFGDGSGISLRARPDGTAPGGANEVGSAGEFAGAGLDGGPRSAVRSDGILPDGEALPP